MSWEAKLRCALGDFVLDLSVAAESKVLALVGPNGCGKSTFLRCLLGAHEAQGVFRLGERTLLDGNGSVPTEQRSIGYMPQGHGLFPHLSALDNVAFGLSFGAERLDKKRRRERACAMLEALGCARLGPRPAHALSGGEAQRIALARALVVDPEMLLLDEPLAALDLGARREMRAFIRERLAAFAGAVVVVTHDVRDVRALDAEVCVLEDGRVLQHARLDALRAAPASPFVEEFALVQE